MIQLSFRRPVKPVLYDSYEYYDDDEYEYEDYEGEEKEVAAKEEKVEEKETRRRPFSSTKPKVGIFVSLKLTAFMYCICLSKDLRYT